jgi:hypothetical protein
MRALPPVQLARGNSVYQHGYMEKSLMAQTDKLGVFRVEAPLTGNVKEITIDQLEIFSGFSSGLGKNPEHPYCLQILDIPFYSTVECLLKSALCVQLGVVVLLILHCYFPLALQRGMRPHTSVCDGSVAGFHCKQHPQIECEILVSFDLLDYFSDLLAMILQVR